MNKRKDTPRPFPDTLDLPLTGTGSYAHLNSEGITERLPEAIGWARNMGSASIGQIFLGSAAYHVNKDTFAGYPGVFFLMGIHPCDEQEYIGTTFKATREAPAEGPRLRAVGEISLDLYWKSRPPLIRGEAFRVQLTLAKETDRPVIIHSRDAAKDTLRILEAEGFSGRLVLQHCSSGDAVVFPGHFLANGWHISIPGPVTYPTNRDLREAVKRIPSNRLMVETDCPYLSPVPWRGRSDELVLVVFTTGTVALERGMDPAEFWTFYGGNARYLFNAPIRRLQPATPLNNLR